MALEHGSQNKKDIHLPGLTTKKDRKSRKSSRINSRRFAWFVVFPLALYGFRTVLECAGKAARSNRTPATGDTSGVCREPGCQVPRAPRRRRFPLAATPWF